MADKIFYLEVAIDTPLDRTFTYHHNHPVSVGWRVLVPFGKGNRSKVGVIYRTLDLKPEFKTKAILAVEDESAILDNELIDLASWLASYYFHPIGMVVRTMLPGSMSQAKKKYVNLTDKGKTVIEQLSLQEHEVLAQIFAKKPSLTFATFRKKLTESLSKDNESEDLLQVWQKEKLIKLSAITSIKTRTLAKFTNVVSNKVNKKPKLTIAQTEVFQKLIEPDFRDSVDLLWGVTGAGKTEIYLQYIEYLMTFESNSQVLVMVPEISLTPQMTSVFTARFPGQVAVVHSALPEGERWQQLNLIRSGQSRILIGPRSAVFASFRALRCIIVDEEHDGSYKQGSMLRYNGRDVAVVRGKKAKIKVILGSATPSMESFENARQGRYRLLSLNKRANDKPLPRIDLIQSDLQNKISQNLDVSLDSADIPVHDSILKALNETVSAGEQAIIIVNRRGYAYFLVEQKTGEAVKCDSCSVNMTFHKLRKRLLCHYCDKTLSLYRLLAANPETKYAVVGYGSEQAEEYITRTIAGSKVARVDSDTMQNANKLEQTLADFRAKKTNILVGTQMLAKGHDFPGVTLICLLEVDKMLNLPDFRAGERTFQLIVQAAGRAGRGALAGRVLMQTSNCEHPVIKAAIHQDYKKFALEELSFRKEHQFPPESRMICFEINSKQKPVLNTATSSLKKLIIKAFEEDPELPRYVQVLGPHAPALEQVRGSYRQILLLSSASLPRLRSLAKYIAQNLPVHRHLKSVVDIDPQTLL